MEETNDKGGTKVFWKILGIVVAVWIGLAILGALVKSLFPLLVISALIFGGYLLYKALQPSDRKDVTRL
jgi:uncharacterized membrane protein